MFDLFKLTALLWKLLPRLLSSQPGFILSNKAHTALCACGAACSVQREDLHKIRYIVTQAHPT